MSIGPGSHQDRLAEVLRDLRDAVAGCSPRTREALIALIEERWTSCSVCKQATLDWIDTIGRHQTTIVNHKQETSDHE